VRAGGGIYYDRVLSTLSFELDEQTFLFDSSPAIFLWRSSRGSDPTTNLLLSPRFTTIGATPPAPTPPAVTPRPVTPNVDASGNPIGLAELGGFPAFLQFDKNFKTPYSDTFSFGVQREFKGNLVIEVNYFGRLGRRLIADGDAAQTFEFQGRRIGSVFEDRLCESAKPDSEKPAYYAAALV